MIHKLKKLYIEPTSFCNLNCSMCFRHNWIGEKLLNMEEDVFSEVLKFLGKNPQTESVMFAGMGEPLVHKDIVKMVESISSMGIYTELLTNGTLLTAETAKSLVGAGLGRLWVSVDEFEADKYEEIQIGSDFKNVISNIENFNKVRNNCELGMTTVIMKENIRDVEKINSFADKYGFDMINLSHIIPCTPLGKDDCVYDDAEFSVGIRCRIDINEKVKRQYNFCPFIEEGKCFIKSDGEVIPCMQLLHSSYTYLGEEKRYVRGKSFGNIKNERLEDIWNSGEYRKFRQNVHEFIFPDCTLCNGCDDRLENEIDCLFNPHPTCGACLWAQGIARCP